MAEEKKLISYPEFDAMYAEDRESKKILRASHLKDLVNYFGFKAKLIEGFRNANTAETDSATVTFTDFTLGTENDRVIFSVQICFSGNEVYTSNLEIECFMGENFEIQVPDGKNGFEAVSSKNTYAIGIQLWQNARIYLPDTPEIGSFTFSELTGFEQPEFQTTPN